jgi:hypothetical protein
MAETVGQYMTAELAPRQPESGKTRRWILRNRGSAGILGVLAWYSQWRCYVLEPVCDVRLAFSAACLRDIADFLERQTAAQKAGRG